MPSPELPGPVRPAGDRAALVRCPSLDAVHDLRRRVLAAALPGVVDVVPGWASLLVVTERPDASLAARLADLVTHPVAEVPERSDAPEVELPVVYDGADLAAVADEVGCSVAEVVARHAAPTYTVAFLGFLAGFPYLAGLDPVLQVPRLAVPRTRVPAGSVAIAGSQAGVYPDSAPGGWRLLGRTDEILFDPRADPPAALLPGDRVRFAPRIPTSVRPRPARPPAAGGPGGAAALRVREAPPGCVVVDAGRRGHAHLGVPRGGAFDRRSHALANRLVGNPPDAAGLEIPLGGVVLSAMAPVTVAVTGAEAAVTVAAGGEQGRPVATRAAVLLAPGDQLRIGRATAGARLYLAVRGGLTGEVVLGSRSGRPVVGGDELGVGDAAGEPPWFEPVPPVSPPPGGGVELAVVPGPQADEVAGGTLARLCRQPWQVHPASDRTGVRLDGPALPADPAHATVPSGGVLPGFVQLLPTGLPVVLGPDCGTTGGYPVPAVLAHGELDRVAQLRPGEEVRLRARGSA